MKASAAGRTPMTLTQKILAAHAIGLRRPYVQEGDMLRIRVDWTIASELAWNGMDKTYQALGRPPIHDRERFFLAVDHTVDAVTLRSDPRAQKLTQLSRDFARERGLGTAWTTIHLIGGGERQAAELSLTLFHDAGVHDLDQWLSDYSACDFAYLVDFYRTNMKKPFKTFWRDGAALLTPKAIPPFHPTKWVSRWEGIVV